MNKRGISPLIGTVLLIGFTIGIALLIFSWGGRFTTELTEAEGSIVKEQFAVLSDVDFKVQEVSYE